MVKNCCENLWIEIRNAFTRKKSVNKFNLETPFNRCLTTLDLIIIGIATMTGAGIYVLTGELSRSVAGPALIISHLIAAMTSLLNAMIYAELNCQYPKAGALFIFAYISIGEAMAFFLGWTMLMEYSLSISAVARAFGGLINSLSGKVISNATLKYIGPFYIQSHETYPDFIAGCLILILALVSLSGIRISNNFNMVLTLFNYVLILFISIICLVYMQPDTYAPKEKGGFAPFGFSGILQGAAMSFFIYVGFDAIAINSEEADNPSKSLPVANFVSITVLCTAVILCGFSLNMFIPWSETNIDSPFSEAFKSRNMMWASYVASIGIISCLITNSFIHLVSAPKLLYSFSTEGLLCSCFGYLLPKTKVAVCSSLSLAAFTMLLAIILPLESLVEFVSIGCLIGYSGACFILVVLRYSNSKSEEQPIIAEYSDSKEVVRPGELSFQYRDKPLLKHLSSLPCTSTPIVCICLYALLVLMLNYFMKYGYNYLVELRWWALAIVIVLSTSAVLCMIVASLYQQRVSQNHFKVPLVPFYPCLTLFCNSLLLANISHTTWLRYLIWLLCGMVIYFGYGMLHSKLREYPDKQLFISSEEHLSLNYSTIPKEDQT